MKQTSLFLMTFLLFLFNQVFSEQLFGKFSKPQKVEADPELEKYLREAIENFREQMKEGIDSIGMPILDPLELKDIEVNVYENLATLDLQVRKMTVIGLSKFEFRDIYPDLENFYLEVNLTIPEVQSHGTYSLDGKMVKIFPLRGNGDFQINITQAEISGIGQLNFSEDTLQMSKLKLDLTWHKIEVYLENFLGDGNFAQVLQRVIPVLGKNVFDNFKPKILEMMNNALMEDVNRQLKLPEVKKIIQGILPDQNL